MTAHRAICGMLFAFMLGHLSFPIALADDFWNKARQRLVGGAAIAASTGTNPNSVTRLYGFCKSSDYDIMIRCAGYIHGFSTMMTLMGQASAEPGLTPDRRDALRAYGLCHQETVPVADMMTAFLNWTNRNPQEWEENGEYGVFASLREAWPCT